ncbi:hypothetical protein J6TS2_43440 [Heyndrickxia sporothermodurans]|nr:hypothetical protein J6TS2_43440 [Heyndrickxia sporothermodurans]
MKKIVLTLLAGVFLFGGIIISENLSINTNDKNIAAGGGEREPSILSSKIMV